MPRALRRESSTPNPPSGGAVLLACAEADERPGCIRLTQEGGGQEFRNLGGVQLQNIRLRILRFRCRRSDLSVL